MSRNAITHVTRTRFNRTLLDRTLLDRTLLDRTVATAVVGIAITVLTACTDPGTPQASPSGSASPSPSASASASPSPADDVQAPIDKACLDLVSLDTMYQYDPNFGLKADYSPAAGTGASTAVSNGGVACSWVQQSSGDTIDIAVAHPSGTVLGELKAAAAGGTATGPDEFFSSVGGVGTLQVFTGPYWIVATSTYFFEPGDAAPLIDSVAAALS